SLADRMAILNRCVLQDVGPPGQIYNDPATAFTASFLNSQQLNLLSPEVHTPMNQYILLDFGAHQLIIPWTDPRAYAVSKYTGGRILVGIRPDGMGPVPEGYNGPAFFGRVRTLEYHGHEWLAYIEARLPAVPVPEPPDPRSGMENGHKGRARARALIRRLLPTPRPDKPEEEQDDT